MKPYIRITRTIAHMHSDRARIAQLEAELEHERKVNEWLVDALDGYEEHHYGWRETADKAVRNG